MVTIAYSGSLDGFDPKTRKRNRNFLCRWFWTFNNDTVDASTRSGYYLIQAIKILRDKYQVKPNDIQVDWWGKIDVLNMKQVAEENLEAYFIYGGYLPKQESLNRIAKADLLLLPLERSKIPNRGTLFIPGKLYEYLNTGKPVLALCETSDCKTILEKSGLGIFAPPDNPMEIATVLLKILSKEMELSSFKANKKFIQQYSFINKTRELADIFSYCLSHNPDKSDK
ncbi:MAG: glycosyltransferase [Chitinophagaceae bacterium]|nr:glycosyltransferase [Chitinophagaceae bacterium]